jgi:hypothetical protein
VFAFVLIDVEKLHFHILEYLNHCFVYNSSYVWDMIFDEKLSSCSAVVIY